MSCSSSLPTRLLATKTSKLEKKDVPGAANTIPSKPRGNSSTVDLFSLLAAGVDEAASTGSGSIGSKAFAGPPALELPAPSADGGGRTICEPSPSPFPDLFPDPFPDNEPKRPPVSGLPTPSTDGGGGTTSEPAPESEPNLVPGAEPPDLELMEEAVPLANLHQPSNPTEHLQQHCPHPAPSGEGVRHLTPRQTNSAPNSI